MMRKIDLADEASVFFPPKAISEAYEVLSDGAVILLCCLLCCIMISGMGDAPVPSFSPHTTDRHHLRLTFTK